MRKPKKSRKTIGNYLIEISVVVIGVAITLSVTFWISRTSEKRDMSLFLNAIKMELNDNIKTLENAIEDLKSSVRYTEYLQSHDEKELNRDTIKFYNDAFYSVLKYSFMTNAFEMFKGSGVMRLMSDKELLMSLWDVYEEIEGAKTVSEWYFQEKWGEMKNEVSLLIEGQDVKVAPMYKFYTMKMPIMITTHYEKVLKRSKETVAKLE